MDESGSSLDQSEAGSDSDAQILEYPAPKEDAQNGADENTNFLTEALDGLFDPNVNAIFDRFTNYLNAQDLSTKAAKYLTEKLEPNLVEMLQEGSDLIGSLKGKLQLGKRRRRSEENFSSLPEDASLTALIYVDMFLRLIGSSPSPVCVAQNFCIAAKSAKLLGKVPEMMSTHLSDFAAELLIPGNGIDPNFLQSVTMLARDASFDCKAAFPECD